MSVLTESHGLAATLDAPPLASAPSTPAREARVVGLDSIRFICAVVVMLRHLEILAIPLEGSRYHGITKIGVGIFNSLFNGPAAVIVFFIISGFCIHFPYRQQGQPFLASFYARRLIRIGLPALGLLAIVYTIDSTNAVLWSVVCEIVYYALYPVLLAIRRRSNWKAMIVAAYIVVALLIGTHIERLADDKHGYPIFGDWGNWIVGLPCWLLGCWLAENYKSFKVVSSLKMWSIRTAIFWVTAGLWLVRFHVDSPYASNCILLDVFAIPASAWLGFEIAFASQHTPSKLLEWGGGWSYSLYLIHRQVPYILAALGLSFIDTDNKTHLLIFLIAFCLSFVFYLLVEHPSHKLALTLGRRLDRSRTQLAGSLRTRVASEV